MDRAKVSPKEEYAKAITAAISSQQYVGGCRGVDCGGFVTRLMIDSGWEPNYNYGGKMNAGAGSTEAQQQWLEKNWDKKGNIVLNPKTKQSESGLFVSDLEPGDVAIIAGYHVFVYVGEIPGFGSSVVSASLCKRAPMAGPDPVGGVPGSVGAKYTWYRKKEGAQEL